MMLSRISAVCLLATLRVLCQPPQGGPPVSASHLHLNAADPDASIAFWKNVVGASTLTADSFSGVGMSGATILFTKKAPTGSSAGTGINHLAVRVPDLGPIVDNLAKTKFKNSHPEGDKTRLMIEAPEGLLLEVVEDSSMYTSLEYSHTHLQSSQPKEMQAWYVKNLSGRPAGDTGDSVQFPGAMLTFTQGDAGAPTLDRAIDHIGFEVKDLAGIAKKLTDAGAKLESPAHPEPKMNATVAVLTDPWGVRLELIQR